jgi:hypothetical protein
MVNITKKTTPNSPLFNDEKRGGNSVKDMSVSLTKIDKQKTIIGV